MQNDQKKKPQRSNPNNYLKYSGMAVQMGAIITIGVLGGKKLDEWLGLQKPICTLVLSLVSVVAAMYLSIKDFIKPKK